MPDQTRARIATLAVAMALVVSVVAAGGIVLADSHTAQPTAGNDVQDTTYLRAIHASPDAPAVNVSVEGETVLSNVSFGNVSDYLAVETGTYNVTISAAEDPDVVVFNDTVTLDSRTATSVIGAGEIAENSSTPFGPVLWEDDAWTPAENMSAISVGHLAPDAPAVDVTAANGSVVLADNVTYRNATDYVTVPAGNYTAEIRPDTPTNDGEVLTTVNVSLESGTAYSALAVGYLDPAEAPADTTFEVVLTEDATQTIHLPGEEPPMNETPTASPTPAETEMPAETEPPETTEMDNETEPVEETEMNETAGPDEADEPAGPAEPGEADAGEEPAQDNATGNATTEAPA